MPERPADTVVEITPEPTIAEAVDALMASAPEAVVKIEGTDKLGTPVTVELLTVLSNDERYEIVRFNDSDICRINLIDQRNQAWPRFELGRSPAPAAMAEGMRSAVPVLDDAARQRYENFVRFSSIEVSSDQADAA